MQNIVKFTKQYWAEILTIAIILAITLIDASPSPSWINTDSDGVHYTYASEWLYPAHKGSAPLYLLLGRLFLFIPIGTEFWRMALISVISGTVASLFILLIIKHFTENKWYAVIGALIYGGSALAISQNTIVESYPLVTAICLGVYYFCLKQKWLTTSILIGVAGAIHPTSILITIPILIYYRKHLITWRRLLVMASFLMFYLYVPLTNRPPYMWFPSNEVGGIFGFVKDSVDTATMLTGKLAIYDFPKRLLDASGLILLNFAVIGIIPLIYYFKREKWYKDVLFWMIVVPALYYLIDIAPQTYVYLQPSIAFGAIAIGLGLNRMRWGTIFSLRQYKWFMGLTSICILGLFVFNANYFDIGRTLDKNLSATEYYEVELDKVPDGQILMPYYGWEWASVFRYNKENDRNIKIVCIDTLANPLYQNMLTEQGVKFEDNFSEDRLTRQNYLALSIVRLNDNVWTTRTIDPKTYGCEVILAKGNEQYLNKIPSEPSGQWHWIPDNPYSIITGSIEIEKWCFITMSNHNMLFIIVVVGVTYLVYIMAEKRLWKKKTIAKQLK